MTAANEEFTHIEHEEIRHHFEDLLGEIHHGVVQLGSMVLENTKRAAESLTGSLGQLDDVLSADDEIDALYAKLERQCFEVMARQQPVARDLRFLISVTRMLYELERSGDLAVNCAKAAHREGGFALSDELRAMLQRLVIESTGLFGRGIDAFAEMDSTAGSRLDQEDDVVDDLCSDFYTQLVADSEDLGLSAAIELSRIARYLERIADHAVNVAENITYIVTGQWPHIVDPAIEERNE